MEQHLKLGPSFLDHSPTYKRPVGLLCASDQLVTNANVYTTRSREASIRDPTNLKAVDLRLTRQSHRDRFKYLQEKVFTFLYGLQTGFGATKSFTL